MRSREEVEEVHENLSEPCFACISSLWQKLFREGEKCRRRRKMTRDEGMKRRCGNISNTRREDSNFLQEVESPLLFLLNRWRNKKSLLFLLLMQLNFRLFPSFLRSLCQLLLLLKFLPLSFPHFMPFCFRCPYFTLLSTLPSLKRMRTMCVCLSLRVHDYHGLRMTNLRILVWPSCRIHDRRRSLRSW